MLSRKSFLFVVSAPSGTGKTTLCRALLRHDGCLSYSVSATTRPKRAKEVEGQDYYFMTDGEFTSSVAQGAFVEWEDVYGARYGTLHSELRGKLKDGHDVILDLDVKGALHVKSMYPESVAVFLLPPTMEELRHRLITRGREGKDIIEARLGQARSEIERACEFDYVVVNDTLAESTARLAAILDAERSRSTRLTEIKLMEDR